MTTQNNEVQQLKKQVFQLSDDFDSLYSAYDGLQVMSSSVMVDAKQVASVIGGLNYRFEALILELHKLYQS